MLTDSTEFACFYSSVLKAAFEAEENTNTYRMDDVSSGSFRLLLNWLYSQDIENPSKNEIGVGGSGGSVLNAISMTPSLSANSSRQNTPGITQVHDLDIEHENNLIRLWIAASRLSMPCLQNLVIKRLEELWGNPADPDEEPFRPENWLIYLYEQTTADSPLRNFVVDRFAYGSEAPRIREMSTMLPKEFLVELALVFAEGMGPTRAFEDLNAGDVIEYTFARTWRSYLVPEEV